MSAGGIAGETTWRDITIAWASPSQLHDFTEADAAAMGQRERLRELSGSRAQAFLAGRALMRALVRRITGTHDVVISSRCARCGADHGRPRADGVLLSVSHAEGLVVVAVAPAAVGTAASLGVDVEQASAAGRVDELRTMFPDGAAPDLAGWTRIEAAVKADGRGFETEPSEVLLRLRENTDPCVWSAALPSRAATIDVTTLVGPPGYVLSVARG